MEQLVQVPDVCLWYGTSLVLLQSGPLLVRVIWSEHGQLIQGSISGSGQHNLCNNISMQLELPLYGDFPF